MKQTEQLSLVGLAPQDPAYEATIRRAATILRAGGTVAFPTETVYGLGANALDPEAVAGIFRAKQRPAWDPLIVHVSNQAMLAEVVESLTGDAERLARHFWPGPLTLLLPRSPRVPDAVTAGRRLVGVRMPAHPVALALIEAAGVPIAAPSANTFGRTSPTRARYVAEDLMGRIDAILDGGDTEHGLESTVVEPQSGGPYSDGLKGPKASNQAAPVGRIVLYRPGIVTAQQLQAVCRGEVVHYEPAEKSLEQAAQTEQESSSEPESLPSPGVGIRHYAPRARLELVAQQAGSAQSQSEALLSAVHRAEQAGEQVGVLLPEDFAILPADSSAKVYAWGSWQHPEQLAQRLFAGLRELDAAGVTWIVCPLPPDEGVGRAICDRLHKAARPKE